MEDNSILGRPIRQLGLSPAFVTLCEGMGVEDLEAILTLAPAELLALPGFSYHWLAELTLFLKERGILHLLQSTPGKSYG